MSGNANPVPRLVLIGGTSHTGKSTLARAVAEKLGFDVLSTDTLARHPGRPWPTPDWQVPPHVAAHYAGHSLERLLQSVLRHYGTLAPRIAEIVRTRNRLVVEGSALWPETVAGFDSGGVTAVWLTAGDDFLRARILRESNHEAADADGKLLIEKFAARAIAFNHRVVEACTRLGLTLIDVEQCSDLGALIKAVTG